MLKILGHIVDKMFNHVDKMFNHVDKMFNHVDKKNVNPSLTSSLIQSMQTINLFVVQAMMKC